MGSEYRKQCGEWITCSSSSSQISKSKQRDLELNYDCVWRCAHCVRTSEMAMRKGYCSIVITGLAEKHYPDSGSRPRGRIRANPMPNIKETRTITKENGSGAHNTP